MPERSIPPLHDWHRNYPTARAITAELLLQPLLLNLRTTTLERDIRDRFGVAPSTARTAIGYARRHAGQGSAR